MYPSMTNRATDVALVLAMMTAGMALFAHIAGRFSQIALTKTVFCGSILRATANLGLAMAVLLSSLAWLIVSSFLWGIGGAFYTVGLESGISEMVVRLNRAEAFGRLQSVNSIGSMIGAFIAFFILASARGDLVWGAVYMFIFFAGSSIIGGGIVLFRGTEMESSPHRERPNRPVQLRHSAYVLVLAFAISAFIIALVTPFVELYIIATVSSDVVLVALTYLPGAILGAILGPRLGRISDRGGKIRLLVAASVIGSVSVILIVAVPYMAVLLSDILSPIIEVSVMEAALLLIAVLFTNSAIASTAIFVIMLSVMGTAYEGEAGQGVGMYESSLAVARVTGPIAGGIMWDVSSPATPILVVGVLGLIVIPFYYLGIQQYDRDLQNMDLDD